MRNNIYKLVASALIAAGITACGSDAEQEVMSGKYKLEFSMDYPAASRATETSFEKDDQVGIFVTKTAEPLEIAGNTLTNEKLTFSGTAWTSSRNLYWDAGFYNVYGYYPFISTIPSINDLEFEVSTDQRKPADNKTMDPYEASDFLYASSLKYAASSAPVNLQFRHILSKLTIRLVKGDDYEGDLPEEALVEIHNTVPKATIDLEYGIATKDRYATVKTIAARRESAATYTAIIVPQRLDNKVPLIEISTKGVSYLFESKFNFKPGVHHLVNLIIDDNPEKIKIEVGGEIVGW